MRVYDNIFTLYQIHLIEILSCHLASIALHESNASEIRKGVIISDMICHLKRLSSSYMQQILGLKVEVFVMV